MCLTVSAGVGLVWAEWVGRPLMSVSCAFLNFIISHLAYL